MSEEVAGTTESAKERANNDNLMYIDINSSHPPSIKKQIPISINKRISKLLSNEEIFNNNIRTYSDALKRCGFQRRLLLSLKHHPIHIPTRDANVDVR